MDAKRLLELRRQAERAVADMPDAELKVKAFEVILAYLLEGSSVTSVKPGGAARGEKPRVKETRPQAGTIRGRILVLRDEGFFKNPRTIAGIREELQAHGWHYPLTTLSGRLQGLVQKRKLRRQRVKQGKKKVWKYSNP